MKTSRFVRCAVLAIALSATACSSSPSKTSSAQDARTDELIGLFRLAPGATTTGGLTGTYFRMLQPGAKVATGPYMVNGDSPADGGKATLLAPGTSGGLRTGGYQSQPTPAFDGSGNSLAAAITQPTKFFGVQFSISTNQTDPQTKADVAPPTVTLKDGKLTADLSAWAASWNKQDFNQGAPKPVPNTQAEAPGQQKAKQVWDWVAQRWLDAAPAATIAGRNATGTYNPTTHAFTLTWTSLIQGGPFNSFTGLWHLEGTFEAAGRAPANAPPSA